MHRGNVVAVVGGGDSAVKGAALLSKYAARVYIIYRQASFTRPEPYNLAHLDRAENIERLFNTNVIGLTGTDGLSGLVLDRPVNGAAELPVDGIFIEIGADPRVDLANQLGVALSESDEIIVDKQMRTNVHGVFAAGDVTDGSGEMKQAITAAAQGAVAADSAYSDVARHPNSCGLHAMGFDLEQPAA